MQNYKQKEMLHILTDKEKLEESIFLGFRCKKGIDVSKINNAFNIDFEDKYKNILEKYKNSGHIAKTKDGYSLTDNGFLLSNIILSDFI